MFAVVKTGGKQYKVTDNDVIIVERLPGEKGSRIALTEVFMIGENGSSIIGMPTIKGAQVIAEVLDQTRGDKVLIFKKRRRHTYRRLKGHRQEQTVLRVKEIQKAS